MINDKSPDITIEKNELVFPSLASNAFDISLFETFLPLVSGGTVMMLTNDDIKDVSLLIKRLKSVTVVHAVPALMNQLLLQIEEQGLTENYSHITDLFVGGDKVPTSVLSSMRKVFPQATLHVLYGPTESTIFVAVKSYFPGEEDRFNGVILGKPMPDVKVYILDEKQQLLPVGVKGEICIGGKRVAKGYLNRESLSAQNFVEHPFSKGERIYRTGDLGRWLKDGQIEFMGRSDDQVKVRGYRIELGEVESTLRKIDGVESVAARIWKNEADENEIVAYFSANRAFNASELRSVLRDTLPDYMLPQSYVQLDELPLSHNGKVDYKALQTPTGIRLSSDAEFVPPRTALEEKIVQIWQSVLKQEKIGVLDDFFHLGGHSLKALRLRNEYQKVLNVNLSLKEIFTNTIVEEHTKLIENEKSLAFVEIQAAPEQASYPISDAQRRLWVLSQFESGSVAYNMPGTYPLDTNLDIECLKQAVIAVVERHEALRTIIKSNEEGEVRQWIVPVQKIAVDLPIVDLRNEKEIDDFIAKDALVPFDMENGPLFRMYLLQISDTEFVFYYNLHHIISDGWSMEVLLKDVNTYYTTFLNRKNQKKYELPNPLRIQYKDYSIWQLDQLESEAFADHKRFWLDKINGELPILDFPGMKKRPRIKTYNGNLLSTFIDRNSGAKLKQFSEDHGGSLFMGLLAVWNLLCYKYTGQRDVIIGTPTANRDHSDLENQIGFYANTLALRNTINPDWNFEDFYQTIKQNTLEAFDHQVYPFDRLIEDLEVQHDTSRNAVFSVMLVLQNNQERIEELSEVDNSLLKERVQTITDEGQSMSKFDMVINFREVENYVAFDLVFNTDLYIKSDMEQLMSHFKQLLTAVLKKPKEKIGTIDFLTESERKTLISDFNDTKIAYPSDKTIVDLFEMQADRTPNKVALGSGDRELTYRELNASANQFARFLSKKWELQAEELVGVDLIRGVDYALALLAVLKLGGCSAPINKGLAEESLKKISRDFKGTIDQQVLDEFVASKGNYSTDNLDFRFTVDNLAYVIYTSGSTGHPKGCMLEHRGIVNHLFSKIDTLSLTSESVIVHASKMCFVGGIWQLWAPLLVGGKVIIPTTHEILDIRALLNKAIDLRVKAFEVIPSQIDNLFKLGENSQLGEIEQLILTGEPLKQDLIERILTAKPSIEIINTYGQTECSDVTTMYRISKKKEWNHRMVGKPIQNTQHFILDENNMHCPIGVTGEIHTSGPGVSRGYLNQPELTEKVFINDEALTGQRLYKTGDLGRWTKEGEIEILGRADQQIKIRGFRIELGEIEQALLKQVEVAEAVVLAVENDEKEKELIAYLTLTIEPDFETESNQLTSIHWREKLKAFLPDYMLPLYFVRMDEMPLTNNGKINKNSLPRPKELGLRATSSYVAPRSELEENLVGIWQRILNHEKLGVEDDFFALGGHSLKAVRITNAYFETFGVKMPLQELFSNTTISSHAVWISNAVTNRYEAIPVLEKNENNEYPVSDAQRRLWILSQFEDSSVAYNMPGQVFLNEGIQIEYFTKAVHTLIERHEILRTVFRETEAGELVQKIINPDEFGFTIGKVDLRSETDKARAVRMYVDQDTRKSFDLENGPLIRAALLQVEDNEFEFYYNTHHIISDGWSGEILANDVFAFYEASINKSEPNLSELPVQYKDYANWQLEQLKEEAFEQHRVFWKNELSGELPAIDLPTYKKRPVLKTHNGRGKKTWIDHISVNKLKQYLQENGGSLFMGLLAVWNVLLHRYSGQIDLIFGTPVAGRDHPDLENQIGFYVNTLALRNKISPSEDTFGSFFEKVKQSTLNAFDHQQYPFDRLVDELGVVRDTSRNAVFDIMVKLMNIREDEVHLGEVGEKEIDEIIDLGWMAAKFDLEVSFQEFGEYLSFELVFNSDVYDDEMITDLMIHFRTLLNRIIAESNVKIAEIDFLSDDEKEKLTETFNRTEINNEEYSSIIQLFENQVRLTPDQPALHCKDRTLSYEQLNNVANQFADYLSKERKIGSGDLVGVKLKRDEWLIIAILGVLKTGGAYVSIDPQYPKERIEFIEKDTSASLCIDDAEIQRFAKKQSEYSTRNNAFTPDKDQLAYIIYTSGSTGTPKGVMIPHGSVAALIQWSHNEFAQTNVEEVFFTTSINFDLSVFEMFFPLTSGKSVRILQDGLEIPEYLNSEKRCMVNTVPSVIGTLLQEGVDLGSITALNMAGEPIPQNYKEQLVGKIGEIRNLYGPSEDTTYSTCMRVDLDQRDLIGKPIDHTQVYVLNASSSIQPIGVVGEIYIAGAGLAKGYLNQLELTAEKFLENPFKPGTKYYKTGDLGRWLPDGNLQFVGRKDRQVKIRGYRIELNEITTQLLTHDKIENGIVTTLTNDQGHKELVAYFVLSEESVNRSSEATNTSIAEELKALLKSKLPSYMVPSYFVRLEVMPLTPNGKIDEKGLPLPDGTSRSLGSEYVEARDEIEAKMIAVWEEVLQQNPVGIKDDFFMLGGHSLKAVRIRNRYQKELNVSLSLKELFTHSTIETQSELIKNANRSEFEEIPKADLQTTYPVSEGQKRLWILSQFDAASKAYSISNTINLSGKYNRERLQEAVNRSVERHEVLRTVFTSDAEGNIRQQILSASDMDICVDFIDVQTQPNKKEQVQDYIQSDQDKVFDLENGPLFRVCLIQLETNQYLLYFNMHHIVCDDWSIKVLFKDTMFFYEQIAQIATEEIAPLRIQYKDYAVWQQTELTDNGFNVYKAFWLSQLSGELPVLDLPFAKERPAFRSFEGGIWSTEIDPVHVTKLRAQSHENGGTVFHGLLAAWLILIQKYTMKNDLLIGTSVAGRNHADLEHQVGYFSNSIALRNTLNPTDSFHQVLLNTIQSTTEAMNHQDYPFNRLVEELGLKRESNRNPLFDTMFVYNTGDQVVDTDAATNFEEVHHSESKAKLDLEISILDMGSILSFRIIYDADVFESMHIKNMLLRFKLLVKELLNDSTKPIKELSIDGTSRKEKKKKNLSKLMSKK